MAEVVVAHFVAGRIAAHEMTLKLLKSGVKALRITLV